MGHQDQGGVKIAVEREQQVGDAIAGLAIEVAGRFIGEQHPRPAAEGARQRHTLLLAAGQLRRQVIEPFAQSQLFQQLHRLLAALPVALAAQQRRQLHVFQRVQRRHQHERLKHEADVPGAQRGAAFFVQRGQRLAQQAHLALAAVIQPGQNAQQGRFPRSGFADQGDRLRGFDKQLDSGKDGELMLTLTNVFTKMMNFKNVFRWHLPFLLLLGLFSLRAVAADTLLILGDSLSAGYRLPIERAWPTLLAEQWQKKPGAPQLVNASISGDTAAQGLARLPALLKQHQPRWVLIELGANDGLRGFPAPDMQRDLGQIITRVQQAGAQPLLMQIRIPPNYGRRYTEAFSAVYPALAKQFNIPLLPFYMEQVVVKPEWMQDDGLHPNGDAQPFIATWMAERLEPLVKHESN